MNIFRELTSKPWTESQTALDNTRGGGAFALPTFTLGLRVFLAVVTVVFSLTVVAYSDRMTLADWRPVPEPLLLWLNTVVLIAASAAFEWARLNARHGRIARVEAALLVGGALTLAFLAGQLHVARLLAELGYYSANNPALAFFWLVTGLHGAHLLGGLVAWSRSVVRIWRGSAVEKVRLGVELCTVYWHFLLAIWLILFALLLFT